MIDSRFLEDLRTRHNAGERLDYVFFWGHKPDLEGVTTSCFSQWYVAPFVVDGIHYPTAEHFMMAEKATLFGDAEARAQILNAPGPKTAKALGRKVRGFSEPTWHQHRFEIVVRASRAKFSQNPELGAFLRQTGNRILVEASPFDRVWGIGLSRTNDRRNDPNLWRGTNLLGFALMVAREGIAWTA